MKVDVPARLLPADRLGRVHFVGIGGAGLSGIARIMLDRGMTVSGSDAQDSPTLAGLRDRGARVAVGHRAEHVAHADTVVVSTAVREDNPEVLEARRRGLRLLPRSAALESVMQGRRVVAVAGTHGKTTTTSLLTVALQAAGADPAYAIGGDLTATGTNAADGSGDLFVAEADESDGAFLVYSPHAALVTNVEADHLDNYGTEAAYRAAFSAFVDRLRPGGFLVVVADDPGAASLADEAAARGVEVVRVGEGADVDLRAQQLTFAGRSSGFDVVDRRAGEVGLGRVTLQIPGRHYVLDALAAFATGLRLGYAADDLRRGLEGFTGTRRRMEAKGEAAGVRVYDSYAHHPNEIAADLAAARAVAGAGRLIVAFQPHLVSRTKIFGPAMGAALAAADQVVVMDVYLAREDREPGVDGGLVASHVPLPADAVRFVPQWDQAAPTLVGLAGAGDLVLTLGAGDVTHVGPEVLRLLAERDRGPGEEPTWMS